MSKIWCCGWASDGQLGIVGNGTVLELNHSSIKGMAKRAILAHLMLNCHLLLLLMLEWSISVILNWLYDNVFWVCDPVNLTAIFSDNDIVLVNTKSLLIYNQFSQTECWLVSKNNRPRSPIEHPQIYWLFVVTWFADQVLCYLETRGEEINSTHEPHIDFIVHPNSRKIVSLTEQFALCKTHISNVCLIVYNIISYELTYSHIQCTYSVYKMVGSLLKSIECLQPPLKFMYKPLLSYSVVILNVLTISTTWVLVVVSGVKSKTKLMGIAQ